MSSNKKSNKLNKKPNPLALKAIEHLQKFKEEEERIQKLIEEENRKLKEEEDRIQAELKAIEDKKNKKKEKKLLKINALKEAGNYKTKSEKNKEKKIKEQQNRSVITSNIITESIIIENEEINNDNIIPKRSPIICVMGHVDTGKTKLMDKIRDSNIQDSEVAGITQQIGATFIPIEHINKKSKGLNITNIPGLLMIDTPGHEAFLNLRKRGSSLADIVILVIDLVHGLEQQTIESINILKESNTKFIIALNKIDRLYGWNSIENGNIIESLEKNKECCMHEFNNRLYDIKGQLQEQGINSELYWNNTNIDDTISICPTSAFTGEGVSNLLSLLINTCETDINLSEQIKLTDELKCIIMEKSYINKLGLTVDVLLINGTLKKNDNIIIKTVDGIIKTQIRNLLTTKTNFESTLNNYESNNSLTGSIGFKLIANNIDNILIGSEINYDLSETINEEIKENDDLHYSTEIIETSNKYKLQDNGILVYASSEGSLEALMHHLQNVCDPPVEISNVHVSKVMKKHINKMIISNKTDYKELNTILVFDVSIDSDAQELANLNKIKIITDGTIFRLYKQYEEFRNLCEEERKSIHRPNIVYPCIIQILKDKVFRKKSPFIFGVKIIEGNLHINTPLMTDKKVIIGIVSSIQKDNNDVNIALQGSEVCIKIDDEKNYTYGRQFDHTNLLYSNITRNSIDIMKKHFSKEITENMKKLILKIMKI